MKKLNMAINFIKDRIDNRVGAFHDVVRPPQHYRAVVAAPTTNDTPLTGAWLTSR